MKQIKLTKSRVKLKAFLQHLPLALKKMLRHSNIIRVYDTEGIQSLQLTQCGGHILSRAREVQSNQRLTFCSLSYVHHTLTNFIIRYYSIITRSKVMSK
jgi:hypothetical protein